MYKRATTVVCYRRFCPSVGEPVTLRTHQKRQKFVAREQTAVEDFSMLDDACSRPRLIPSSPPAYSNIVHTRRRERHRHRPSAYRKETQRQKGEPLNVLHGISEKGSAISTLGPEGFLEKGASKNRFRFTAADEKRPRWKLDFPEAKNKIK